jgi:hypothetical protein
MMANGFQYVETIASKGFGNKFFLWPTDLQMPFFI